MIRDFLKNIYSVTDDGEIPTLTLSGIQYIPKNFVEGLIDKVKMLELALHKRIETIKILEARLKKDQDLLQKMHTVLEAQNRQLHEQMDIINDQRQKLKHIEQIDWRMNKLKLEQKKLIKYTQG
ncbi:TPA: hypothetical protein CPT80_02610 [Candidatus Gastranaerophilales bacterium HUM_9]|nr:MAG TPA: hypothetical protein CPT80_02610 [Candidatus Gastranaerophilales bacterium HUM_9]HBX34754.1 hypothetical protein [Cyanobacteria bacterium UBA11440]